MSPHVKVPPFDKRHYQAANAEIVEALRQTHDWESTEGFIADGVVCPEEYQKQSIRIVCVLAESYGYDRCGVTSIEDQSNKDVLGLTNWAVKTPRQLTTLLWLLHRSFDQRAKVSWDDMPWLFRRECAPELQSTVKRIGWINVKKASRAEGTQMVAEEIYAHAKRNVEILRRQLEVAVPHLLIGCSSVVFHALREMDLLGINVAQGRKWQIQSGEKVPWVVEVSHPRTWRGYQTVYKNFEELYGQLEALRVERAATPFS